MRKEQIITTNNNQMEEKGMKSRFIHFKKRFVPAVYGALMGVMIIIDKVKLEDLHDNTMKQMSCLIRTLQKIKMLSKCLAMLL